MTPEESRTLRGVFNSSEIIYRVDRLLYFFCLSALNDESKDIVSLGLEPEIESELPKVVLGQIGSDASRFKVYSYDLNSSNNVYEFDSFLNTKLPTLIDKDTGDYEDRFEDILIFEPVGDSEIKLIDNDHPIFKKIRHFFNLLRQLSSYVSQEGSKFLFWINSVEPSGKSSSKIVEFTFKITSLHELESQLDDERFPVFDTKGPHEHEKIVLFKRALLIHLEEVDTPRASDVLRLSNSILNVYDDEYFAYISKFGLDKSLNELNDKLIDIITKISDAIQGTALKLLIIPATMLATILMRQSNSSDIRVVFIIIIVAILVWLLHTETKQYVSKVAENGQRLLDTIINLNAGPASATVAHSQKEVKESLDSIRTDTLKRIHLYKWGSLASLVFWTLIIFWSSALSLVSAIPALLGDLFLWVGTAIESNQ